MEIQEFNTPKEIVRWITLGEEGGPRVVLSTLGAGIVRAYLPDKDGKVENVVFGYRLPEDYFDDGPCSGKCPGRYANRIARGHLELDGEVWQLAINNGPNALHGGPTGFQNHIWDLETDGDDAVIFSLHSPDGDENYPGALDAQIRYDWRDGELTLTMSAVTDKTTVVNLTNHAYWNLDGIGSGKIYDHLLTLRASRYLPTDETLIPTGEQAPVEGTPMDFTTEKALGKELHADFPALNYGKGYDACWVIDEGEGPVAVLRSERSGRTLEVYSDQPGIQVYTGNWLDGCPEGPDGEKFGDYDAVALEAQGFPDAPNNPSFPSQTLRPGELYHRTITFKFKS